MYQEHTNDREIVVMRSARSIWTSRSACLSVIVAIACQFVADTGGSPARAGESGNDAASAKPATHAETVLIPAPGMGTFGGTVDMHADLFKPDGPGPYPVLIFSHGRAPDRLARAGLKHPIQEWHVRYWLEHGVAVLAPVRVGYGETGGPDRENNGAIFDASGRCTSKPDYANVATALNDATLTTINWVRSQPWADGNRIVLEGRSMGGFASVAAAASRPDGVVGYINFSGGAGGSPDRSPGHSCDPDQMREVMAEFGKRMTLPGLWLYARNDRYFGAEAPLGWYAAFAAGGSPAKLISVQEVPGRDGHLLLSYGQEFWLSDLDAFVKSLGL
ncbi:dienelactone hydrolase [Cupriavidus metallidurans]|jgi:dienelactone hydrolase|uniref:alpha/beta hydrolase family protein n=1 Tax=Cupriavidus metallidurans TaxID=119219 RepID=UPI002381AAA5|nr:CocE/NonD family hydrolase [Cupriavidus metallidurans]MDE4917889.1 CocE/NonD family hydrolase [Cupriavidus metallidurans]